jgi:hypothetical protein
MPRLALNIVQAIDRVVEKERGNESREHLGASVMGRECMRSVWYEFHWAKKKDFGGRMLRLFERGQEEEDRVIRYLRKAGIEVQALDPATGKQFKHTRHAGHMGGSQDGKVRSPLLLPPGVGNLEMKTFNRDAFRALAGTPHGTEEETTWPEAEGVAIAKPEHYSQMQSYMHWDGARWTLYVAVCKDNDDIYPEIVEYNQEYAEHIEARGAEIIFSHELPPRIRTDMSYMPCKTCDFAKICHGKSVPDKSCRTCAHSTPEKNGDGAWSCARAAADAGPIPEHFQRQGCEHHVFNPMLLQNIGDYIGGSEEKNYAEYRLPDGSTFKNGTRDPLDVTVIASDELEFAPLPLSELDKKFREQFAGASFIKPRKITAEKKSELEQEAALAKKQFTQRAVKDSQKRGWKR